MSSCNRSCTPEALAGSECSIRGSSSACSQPCRNVSSSLGSCIAVIDVVTQAPPACKCKCGQLIGALVGKEAREGWWWRVEGGTGCRPGMMYLPTVVMHACRSEAAFLDQCASVSSRCEPVTVRLTSRVGLRLEHVGAWLTPAPYIGRGVQQQIALLNK